MTKIIIDTNFLLVPFQFRVDIFSEFERICNSNYKLCIYNGSIGELRNIVEKSGGKDKKAATPYAKTSRNNVVKFEWKYGVDKDKEVGTYEVRAVLRENKKQIRVGTFRVE